MAVLQGNRHDVIDYKIYLMDKKEKIKYTVISAVFLAFLGYLFFDHLLFAILFSAGSLYYPRWKAPELAARRKKELNLQFRDALYSLASFLAAGKSMENAIRETNKELQSLYPEKQAFITQEMSLLCQRMELNEPLEVGLLDFADRSGLEDIKNFADVVSICKRTGGNLVQVVQSTSKVIGTKLDILEEIDLLLTRQRYEQRILNVMPLVFIALLRFGGAGYMEPMYESVFGYLAMGAAASIIFLAHYLSARMIDIRV